MSYTYSRARLGKREEIEKDSLKDAKEEAIRNWAAGTHIPLHISDESGKQVLGHADLRKFLLDKTGIGKFDAEWK